MQVKYNREDDILMIQLSKKRIDYAEQSGDLIVHFSPEREAVLLEILDASEFLKNTAQKLPRKIKQEILDYSLPVTHSIKK